MVLYFDGIMPNVDYRGARGSNTGDYFHELWAARRALSLLEHGSELTVLTVEGLRPEDETGQSQTVWEGVDCCLYYGAAVAKECKRIEIEQLKYSPSAHRRSWTVGRLTKNTAKQGNNSVIRRLANAFRAVRKARGTHEGIAIRLVSNQSVAPEVFKVLQWANAGVGSASSSIHRKELSKFRSATGLSGQSLRQFVKSLDLSSQTGSRFALEENILRTIATWTDDDARVILNALIQFISRKMLPESKGEFIGLEDVLLQFHFSSRAALFPCPQEISRINNPVTREVASAVVREMRNGQTFICLHGPAGCGKTTALQEIERELPRGSEMLVFDCFGAGSYLDSNAYRHRPKDAFRQLTNEIATRLRVPLFLTRSQDNDYPRSFRARLGRASEILASRSKDALLVLAVDAADNSVIAANSLRPRERSFVHDFVNLGSLPENARIIVTARSGRLDELSLPVRFCRLPLYGFSREETKANAERHWPHIPDAWVDDFHYLTGGNPRVQAYAIEYGSGDPASTLEYLRPKGRVLDQIFSQRLEEALVKGGGMSAIEAFCGALVTLPRPIPRGELACISDLSIAQVRDICADLSPAIRVTDSHIGFSDEDFEHFVREKASDLGPIRARVAQRFSERHVVDAYAAAHLAPALLSAGRGKELRLSQCPKRSRTRCYNVRCSFSGFAVLFRPPATKRISPAH